MNPRGYYPPSVHISAGGLWIPEGIILTVSIPLQVDWIPEGIILPVSIPLQVDYESPRVLSSQCPYLCRWTMNPRGYYPPSVDTSAGGLWIPEGVILPVSIPLQVDYESPRVLSSQFPYLCRWTMNPRGYYPPSVDTSAGGLNPHGYYPSRGYYPPSVDTSTGGLWIPKGIILPESIVLPGGIILPVVSVSVLTWIIKYVNYQDYSS